MSELARQNADPRPEPQVAIPRVLDAVWVEAAALKFPKQPVIAAAETTGEKCLGLILLQSLRDRASELKLTFRDGGVCGAYKIDNRWFEIMDPPVDLAGDIRGALMKMFRVDPAKPAPSLSTTFSFLEKTDEESCLSFGDRGDSDLRSSNPEVKAELTLVRKVDGNGEDFLITITRLKEKFQKPSTIPRVEEPRHRKFLGRLSRGIRSLLRR